MLLRAEAGSLTDNAEPRLVSTTKNRVMRSRVMELSRILSTVFNVRNAIVDKTNVKDDSRFS